MALTNHEALFIKDANEDGETPFAIAAYIFGARNHKIPVYEYYKQFRELKVDVHIALRLPPPYER